MRLGNIAITAANPWVAGIFAEQIRARGSQRNRGSMGIPVSAKLDVFEIHDSDMFF
jgi:hypothetical protein